MVYGVVYGVVYGDGVVYGVVYGVGDGGIYEFKALDFAELTDTATGMATTLHITIQNTTAATLRPSEMLAFDLADAMLPRLSSSFA